MQRWPKTLCVSAWLVLVLRIKPSVPGRSESWPPVTLEDHFIAWSSVDTFILLRWTCSNFLAVLRDSWPWRWPTAPHMTLDVKNGVRVVLKRAQEEQVLWSWCLQHDDGALRATAGSGERRNYSDFRLSLTTWTFTARARGAWEWGEWFRRVAHESDAVKEKKMKL